MSGHFLLTRGLLHAADIDDAANAFIFNATIRQPTKAPFPLTC